MEFDVKNISAHTSAQLGCRVCDGNDNAIGADSVCDRKAIRVRTAVRARTEVHQERIAKLVGEARIRENTLAELRCTAGDLVCNDAGRPRFSALVTRR